MRQWHIASPGGVPVLAPKGPITSVAMSDETGAPLPQPIPPAPPSPQVVGTVPPPGFDPHALPGPVPQGDIGHPLAVPGSLVPWSRVANLMVWAGITVGLAMVAHSSSVTGLGTWWMGPPGHQTNVLTIMLPFLVPLGMLILVLSWSTRVPWFGILGSVLLGAVAVADISHVKGYALVEGALAVCGLVVSVASIFGRYHATPATDR